jgi:RND family efflux transporter MFP subunit
MDINMADQADTEVKSPRFKLPPWVRKFAVFAAPFLVLVLAGLSMWVLSVTGPKPEEKSGDTHPVAVQFAVAEARPTTISVSVQGEARPRVEAALAAQVAGRIVWASPSFADGGSFRQGDALVRIDPADYELAVVRARAQVAQAEEALAREEAESDLARQDWNELGRGDPSPLAVREPQLAQARAGLAAARAQLRSAELDLARTHIRAPFTGRMRSRSANIGDYVGPGAPVAEVFATDFMEIRVPLTDANLSSLRTPVGFIATAANPGPSAHVSAISGDRIRTWEGRLVRTESTVDARTRLVYGVVEVREPFAASNSSPLAPGMFVSVAIEGSSRETLVAAPRSALKRNEFVYVIGEGDTINVRNVRPAQTTADEVMFREGVADGERVVVSHLASPREGMPVTPINRAGETAEEAAPAPAAAAQEPLDIRE